jgi:hypothetical protein
MRIIGGPKWSPAPPTRVETRAVDHSSKDVLLFAVLGDIGTGKVDQHRVGARLAEECAAHGGCDFVLVGGDNIYPAGVERLPDGSDGPTFDDRFRTHFEEPYAPLGEIDVWLVPGNHDWYTRGSVDAQVAYSLHSPRWRMPSPDFEVPGLPDWIHVYGLDTTPLSKGLESGQIARAHEVLCDAGGWRLLFGHHPVYSSGKHADPGGVHPAIERALLGPLIERCAIHVYFAGHDHHQEHLSAAGFEQIVQGAGGKLRGLRDVSEREPGVRSLVAAKRFGFALVEATPETLHVRFFGYSGEFHCSTVSRAEFTTPDRTQPCEE